MRKLVWATWSCRNRANTVHSNDSKIFRGPGLHAIRRIFGEAAVDDSCGRGVILVVRQDSGSTPVLLDNWNLSVKTVDRSLAAYLRGRFDRPPGPEDDFSLSE